MKYSIALIWNFTYATLAFPQLLKRQTVSNELTQGNGCKKVTFIFARASTEPGNMLQKGGSMGPRVCKGLKAKLNNDVACQGVGSPYTAGLMDNVSPAGTTQAAIGEATKMFTQADSKCPKTIITAGGYSQGTAVMMNAISKLNPSIKNKVVGVVLFGYTKNAQTKSSIPNYPKANVQVYCAKDDGVCGGALLVTGGHFSYRDEGPKAVDFLISKINGGSSGPSAAETMTGSAPGGGKSSGKGGKGKGKGKGTPAPPTPVEPEAPAEGAAAESEEPVAAAPEVPAESAE